MNSLYGTNVIDKNIRLRLLVFSLFGTIALASLVFWRQKLILSTDYVDFPMAEHLKAHDIDNN